MQKLINKTAHKTLPLYGTKMQEKQQSQEEALSAQGKTGEGTPGAARRQKERLANTAPQEDDTGFTIAQGTV